MKQKSVLKEFMLKRPPQDKPYSWLKRHRDYVPTKEVIGRWFRVINVEMFGAKLPPFREIHIKRKRGRWADCAGYLEGNDRYCIMTMDYKLMSEQHLVEILSHEMVHLWQWMNKHRMGHGDSFIDWEKKFVKRKIIL